MAQTIRSVIGIVASGFLIDLYGVRPVIFVSAIVSAIILLIFGPEVRRAGRAHQTAQ